MNQTNQQTTAASIPGGLGVEPYKPAQDEVYMSDAMKNHFNHILQSLKQGIMEDVDRTVSDMRDEDSRPSDVTDRATREEAMGLILRTRDREGKLLRKIEETLDKIASGEYGYCEACGVEIGLRRLEARPTATLCIDCKTLEEIREKQRGN